jgi:hypothetical protein
VTVVELSQPALRKLLAGLGCFPYHLRCLKSNSVQTLTDCRAAPSAVFHERFSAAGAIFKSKEQGAMKKSLGYQAADGRLIVGQF